MWAFSIGNLSRHPASRKTVDYLLAGLAGNVFIHSIRT